MEKEEKPSKFDFIISLTLFIIRNIRELEEAILKSLLPMFGSSKDDTKSKHHRSHHSSHRKSTHRTRSSSSSMDRRSSSRTPSPSIKQKTKTHHKHHESSDSTSSTSSHSRHHKRVSRQRHPHGHTQSYTVKEFIEPAVHTSDSVQIPPPTKQLTPVQEKRQDISSPQEPSEHANGNKAEIDSMNQTTPTPAVPQTTIDRKARSLAHVKAHSSFTRHATGGFYNRERVRNPISTGMRAPWERRAEGGSDKHCWF